MSEQSGKKTSQGTTVISDGVVSKVAGMSAQGVEGVRMGGSGVQAAGSLLSSVTGGGNSRTQGVSVEVGEKEAAVDLTLTTEYGKPVPQLTKTVRDSVVRDVEGMTGLKVTEVNVVVTDVFFPEDQ